MTNTLTWESNPIQFPKLNSNLLSTISFFVLCLMLFTATAVIAVEVCKSEADALNNAQMAHAATGIALVAVEGALVVAIASLNPIAIAVALGAVGAAAVAHAATAATLGTAWEDYWDCMDRHTASGGCGSGNCNA